MDFTCLGLKVEELWEDLMLLLIKIKSEQFLLVQLIKDNYLFVIGLHDRQMNQEAKMILLLAIGINKDALDLLLH